MHFWYLLPAYNAIVSSAWAPDYSLLKLQLLLLNPLNFFGDHFLLSFQSVPVNNSVIEYFTFSLPGSAPVCCHLVNNNQSFWYTTLLFWHVDAHHWTESYFVLEWVARKHVALKQIFMRWIHVLEGAAKILNVNLNVEVWHAVNCTLLEYDRWSGLYEVGDVWLIKRLLVSFCYWPSDACCIYIMDVYPSVSPIVESPFMAVKLLPTRITIPVYCSGMFAD